MEKLSYRVTLRIIKSLNVLLMVIPVITGWHIFYEESIGVQSGIMTLLIAVVYMLLYVTYGRIYDSFLVSIAPVSEMIYSQCLAFLISDGFLYCIFCLIAHSLVAIWPLVIILLVQVVFSLGWCLATHTWYFHTYPPKKLLLFMAEKRELKS